MKIIRVILFIFCLVLGVSAVSAFSQSNSPAPSSPTAYIIHLNGVIGPAAEHYVDNAFKKAEKANARVIILQMDTPGGLAKAMRQIISHILLSPIPVIGFVAPAGARAASAGTFILYACHFAAMAPTTHLGAATPVQMSPTGSAKKGSTEKLTAMQRKVQNDALAYIRALANLRGRNAVWAEKAVTAGATLSAQEALQQNVINVMAPNIKGLLMKANLQTVKVQNHMVVMHTLGLKIVTIKPDWAAKLLAIITNPNVAYVLLMLGIYGIFFELSNPGTLVPGITGTIFLLVALYALQMLPISYAGLGLMLLGMVLFVAELLVSGFGALGIGGVIALLIGSLMLIRTEHPAFQIATSLIWTVTILGGIACFFIVRFAVKSRKLLVVSGKRSIVGRKFKVEIRDGVAFGFIGAERWQLKSEALLKDGETVIVVDVDGLTLWVKKL